MHLVTPNPNISLGLRSALHWRRMHMSPLHTAKYSSHLREALSRLRQAITHCRAAAPPQPATIACSKLPLADQEAPECAY
jgi:hypothetical protein